MAGIKIGNLLIDKAYFGNLPIDKIFYGSVEVYSSMPQLATPTISLSDDILSIEEVENAEYYDIYVDGVLEESVPAVSGYSGNILPDYAGGGATMNTTYIKFDTPPTNANDYDSCVQSGWGTIEGLTSYSNKTKVYVWGTDSIVKINNVETSGGSTYDTAVEVVLTGDYDIYLKYGHLH